MAEQTPWAERTVELPPEESGFRRGVARVAPRTARPVEPRTGTFEAPQDPAGTGWPGGAGSHPQSHPQPHPQSRTPVSYQLRQLRRGGVWSVIGGLFAFVCWGNWAISARGDFTSPVVTFLLTLGVAVGLFALSRLLGRVVLEGHLGRVRRTARAAHLVTGLFLTGVGIGYLRQTEWVIGVWNWLTALG